MSKAQVDAKFAAERHCRLCRRSWELRPLTRHRIVPGFIGGPYKPVNCVPLCWGCHSLVDGRDLEAKLVARRMLRASLWPVEIAYAQRWLQRAIYREDSIILRRSWNFDDAYPRPARELVMERRAKLTA